MSTEIIAWEGSLLNAEIAEGIAIFLPVGLTEIRPDGEKFFTRASGKMPSGARSDAPAKPGTGLLKHLILIDNQIREITGIEDMRSQIIEVLDTFAELKLKSAAMNGIRCGNLPDRTARPEQYQRQFVEEYLAAHPDAFEKIVLADARGGFNRK